MNRFGSVVVDNPEQMTRVIFEATAKAGVRALVSVGWGGLGKGKSKNTGHCRSNSRNNSKDQDQDQGKEKDDDIPPHIFLLGNVPHDWLFTKVFAVCHHGGAGTTAIGLRCGKPTIVVPFFGDQPFWGAMIHKAGAGPKPIRKERLTDNNHHKAVDRLANAITFCMTEEARVNADLLGQKIRARVSSFFFFFCHRSLGCVSDILNYLNRDGFPP
jgi:UDP:flavonoid glycosyltransferase YjiC (YdhE family)